MNSNLEHIDDVRNRARVILSEIVDAYLNTGNPVSSKLISENLNSLLSPSTVRLIMSNLEEEVYFTLHILHLGEFLLTRDLSFL